MYVSTSLYYKTTYTKLYSQLFLNRYNKVITIKYLRRIFLINCLIISFVSPLTLAANEQKINMKINDGPYVFKNNNGLELNWLCQSAVLKLKIKTSELPLSFDECDLEVMIDRDTFVPDEIVYQGDFKVAAASDFHGQYDLMQTLLMNNHIIDLAGDWSFGNGHFVITGDVFDRGDKVTEILWFLYELEKQAESAGGKLHLLLGNHEVMVLNGDLRYLHPKYVETSILFEEPFEQLYGKNTLLGDWLRSKSVLVKVNNMLFAHGGFHPSLAKEKRTLAEINKAFKTNLVKAELEHPRESWGKYLHKKNGPIWYRGYFKDSRKTLKKDTGASSAEIDLLLKHFDIEHLVVGHTSQQRIETRYKGRVIAIDSSIKNGEYGEILLIDGNKKWRGTLSGKLEALH
jgi:hypothetical protein